MTTTTMTPRDALDAALQDLDAAKAAFTEQARAGFNAVREYLAWQAAVKTARTAGQLITRDWDAAKAEHDREWDALFREANRVAVTNRDIFAAHGAAALRQWEADRATWLQRASAYGGRNVTEVAVERPGGIFKEHASVKGLGRPIAPQLVDPSPYTDALMEACRGD